MIKKNMHEILPLELSKEEERLYDIHIRSNVNKVRCVSKGWIVDFVYTDKNGDYNPSGEYITGYKNGELVTTGRILNSTNMDSFKIVYTEGMDKRPFFVLTDIIENNNAGLWTKGNKND